MDCICYSSFFTMYCRTSCELWADILRGLGIAENGRLVVQDGAYLGSLLYRRMCASTRSNLAPCQHCVLCTYLVFFV